MTDSPSPSSDPIPTVTCRVCGTEVPGGKYCGHCGAHRSRERGDGPDWLRVRAYSAADGENVLRLSMVSTLFPHLPHRSRATFRWGLTGLVILLVAFALLQWQAPLIAVCALGLPLLFLIYVEESDVYGDDDLPERTLLLAAVLGAALGVGWALLTAPIINSGYSSIGSLSPQQILTNGLLIPMGGAVLMLLPAVIVRLTRPKNLESLDGFLIGALGAVAFAAAGTLVRLAPQLASGLVDHSLPVEVFIIEAGLQGIAVPLTAAAVGGLFGAALWFTWQGEAKPRRRRRLLEAALPASAIVLAVYAGIGLIDVAPIRQEVQLALHLLIAVVAVLALRVGVHLALLRETREEMAGPPALCAECNNVVPDMAFCPNCGVATRAASRTSRSERLVADQPDDEKDDNARTSESPGFALPARAYRVPPARYTSSPRLFVILGAGLAAVIAVIVVVSMLTTKPTPQLHCPEDCQGPPIAPVNSPPQIGPGPPVPTDLPNRPQASAETSGTANDATEPGVTFATQPTQTHDRWEQSDHSFSVAHPPGATTHPNGVSWTAEGGQAQLFSVPAHNMSPQDIAQQLITNQVPNAKLVYEIPNARVGYEAGYGEFDQYTKQSSSGGLQTMRVLIMVAVKNDLALVVTAMGPEVKKNHGHPSGANLEIAFSRDFGYYVNSFRWKGDPPR